MKTALLYYKGSGFFGQFVRWWTKSKFAHVAPAIINDDGKGVIYDAYWSTSLTRRLITIEDDLAVWQILPFDESRTEEKRLWLEAQVNKPYNKPAIFIIGLTKRTPGWLHIYVSRQGEWICSLLSIVVAEVELEAWGLRGPGSPQDCFVLVKEKYNVC